MSQLRILPCLAYKDCTPPDFTHYFHDTFMVFNLTDIKTRIFLPEQIDHTNFISGQYLTRLREWKPLQIKWDNWYARLSLIAPFPISFNLGTGAAYWSPNISKQGAGSSGYRKSFPNLNNQGLKLFGKIEAKDKVQQSIIYRAFQQVYKEYPHDYTLSQEARTERTATSCAGGFLVDRVQGKVYYKGAVVGRYNKGSILLPSKQEHLKDFMVRCGAEQTQVAIEK